VQSQDIAAAGEFMQAVDVLSDEREISYSLFQVG